MAQVVITLQGSATIDDYSSGYKYADTERDWTQGGIVLQGSASINDYASDYKYCDTKRDWQAGGIVLQGSATIDDYASGYKYADTKRVWQAGGLILQGSAMINDFASNYRWGDMIRIVFVDTEHQTEDFNILLNVERPVGAVPFMMDEVTHIAWCFRVERRDGVVYGFTSHDEDIVLDGVTYKAKTGFAPTAVSTSDNMSIDNMDSKAFLHSDGITAEDLLNGIWDNAKVEVFLVDYTDLSQDKFVLRRGEIGEITYGDNYYNAELRGLMEAYGQKAQKITTKQCRAAFGDDKCRLALSDYTFSATVTGSDGDGFTIDVIKDEDFFTYGIIEFTSGLNNGCRIEVKKSYDNGRIVPFLPLPRNVATGDTLIIKAGCDGNPTTCRNRFHNIANFRGEYFTPGNNFLMTYPSDGADNIVSEGQSPRRAVYDWGDDD